MKAKKTFVVLTFVLLTTLFFVSTSHAAWYYTMNIVKIGSSDAGDVLTVENAAATVTLQKYLDPVNSNTLLAVILTAQGLGSPIHVYYDTGTDYITGVIISNE